MFGMVEVQNEIRIKSKRTEPYENQAKEKWKYKIVWCETETENEYGWWIMFEESLSVEWIANIDSWCSCYNHSTAYIFHIYNIEREKMNHQVNFQYKYEYIRFSFGHQTNILLTMCLCVHLYVVLLCMLCATPWR